VLRRLHAVNLVKIGSAGPEWTFHPKAYLFTTATETLCWIGSANLTDAGFGKNVEVVHESADDGSVRTWIDNEWQRLEYPTSEWLDRYEEGWKARRIRDQSSTKEPPLAPPSMRPVPPSLNIRLQLTASERTIGHLLVNAKGDSRIAAAPDFQRMCQELLETDYRAISTRPFLWLLGWCNTGGTYQSSSDAYARVLASAMFGYIPEQFLMVGGRNLNLKRYRYRMPPDDVAAAVAEHHRRRLA
jgi:hypothetical protein